MSERPSQKQDTCHRCNGRAIFCSEFRADGVTDDTRARGGASRGQNSATPLAPYFANVRPATASSRTPTRTVPTCATSHRQSTKHILSTSSGQVPIGLLQEGKRSSESPALRTQPPVPTGVPVNVQGAFEPSIAVGCADQHTSCPVWAAAGQCEGHANITMASAAVDIVTRNQLEQEVGTYTRRTCPVSCGVCKPSPTPTTRDIVSPTPTTRDIVSPTPTTRDIVLRPTPTTRDIVSPTPTTRDLVSPTPTARDIVLRPTTRDIVSPTPTTRDIVSSATYALRLAAARRLFGKKQRRI